jgi:hypothetical protein
MKSTAIDVLVHFAEGRDLFIQASFLNTATALEFMLLSSPQVTEAMQAIRAEPAVADAIVRRLNALLTQRLPVDQLHTFDVAIAAYLVALGSNPKALGDALAAVRAANLPNLFWTWQVYPLMVPRVPQDRTEYTESSDEYPRDADADVSTRSTATTMTQVY